jgi:uncharacterized protein with PIN domain
MAGCAANSPNDGSHAMNTSDPNGPQAMTCSMCKAVLVQVPVENGKGRVISYKTVSKDMCPMCKDAFQNYLATGHFEHGCKACGGEMTACVPQ